MCPLTRTIRMFGSMTTSVTGHVGSYRTRSCGLYDIRALSPRPHKWCSALNKARKVSQSHSGLMFITSFHLSHSQTWSKCCKSWKGHLPSAYCLCCLVIFIVACNLITYSTLHVLYWLLSSSRVYRYWNGSTLVTPRQILVSAQGMDNLDIWSSAAQYTTKWFTLP